MQPTEGVSSQAAVWFVEPDRVRARPRGRKWGWRNDDGTSMRAVIVSSIFLALLSVALLVGGHAAINPFLQLAIAARDPVATGDVVMAMPDGKFCRHMSFDNKTAEVLEGAIERCPASAVREQFRTSRGFSWNEKDQ